jgi:8-oxo-dGTP diphosphatase
MTAAPASPPARIVQVVAAALIDDAGRVLLAQRPAGKAMAGLWEFPGGKIEPGETPEAALARELAEELGIRPAAMVPVQFVSHAYDDFHLVMLLFAVRHWTGQLVGRDGQALRWAAPAAMAALPMPAADVPLLAALVAHLGQPDALPAAVPAAVA